MRRSVPALLLAATLLGGACSSDTSSPAVAPVPTTSPDEVAPEVLAYRAAVQATIDAPTLLTDAVIRVATSAGVAEITINVRRQGDRREVDVTTDQGTLRYVLTPQGATVDRGDGAVEVSVDEVPSAPSLSALASIADLAFPEDGVATGKLAGADVAADGAVTAAVDVTVRYDPEGLVRGLELRGPDDDYVALVTYRTA